MNDKDKEVLERFDDEMKKVVINGNKYPCVCCGRFHIEMTDHPITGDMLATHKEARDFILKELALARTQERALIREKLREKAESTGKGMMVPTVVIDSLLT